MTRRTVTFVILLVLSLSAALLAQQPVKKSPPSKSIRGDSAAVKRGAQVYADTCEICHNSASIEKKIGPGLKGLSSRPKFSDGKKVDDASLRRWIEEGGKDMPGFKDHLNPEQIRDLIAYLKTL